MLKNIRKKLIGDKKFYCLVLTVVIPIMVQNGITNFVGLLDNIMIGQVGTEQMSGIAIVNQLLTVFNISIFGAVSGAGIFTAQYYGFQDPQGVRYTFRFKIYACLIVLFAGFVLLYFFGDRLILLYLHGKENPAALDATLHYGKQYLSVMLIGLLPFCVEEYYTGTLRECGETFVPMTAGIAAVLVNLVLNYLLIFGNFGFPALGVTGAAVATVLSRFVQAGIVVIWTHTHTERMPFIAGAYKSPKVPAYLTVRIMKKGTPLMINEILWSLGTAALMQCYSVRGLSAVAAMNISGTIANLFNIAFLSMGNAIAIIVGQILGAGDMEKARDTDTKLIAFSVASCIVIGGALAGLAPLFPRLYNTSGEVRRLAGSLICVAAVTMPLFGFNHACYYTLRSGGRTVITCLFDSAFVLLISLPFAFILSRFTRLPIVPLYFAVQLTELIKCVSGFILVRKGIWLENIVDG